MIDLPVQQGEGMHMKRGITAVVAFLLMVMAGCTAGRAPAPAPPVPVAPPVLAGAPSPEAIAWVEVGLGLPTPPDQQPRPLYPDTEQGRVVTAKLLGWLTAAEPAAGEISAPARTPTLVFRLRNGEGASVRIAYDCITTKTDTGTEMRCGQAAGQVIFQAAGGSSPMRLRSPDLAYWVLQGWRQDVVLGLKQCGAEDFRHGDGYDQGARDCIWEAYRSAVPARFVTTVLTVEGDPISFELYTRSDGKVVGVLDTRADKFGAQRVTTYTCAGMEKRTARREYFHLSGCTGADAAETDTW